jgi:hypothetical protein
MDLTNDNDVHMDACFHNDELLVKDISQKDGSWFKPGSKKRARDQPDSQSVTWTVTKRTMVINEKSTVTWLCDGTTKTFRTVPTLAKYLRSTLAQNSQHGDIAQQSVVQVLADIRACILHAEKECPGHAILRLPVTRNPGANVIIEEM